MTQTPKPESNPQPQEDVIQYVGVAHNPVLWDKRLPLEWRRVDRILIEKASILAEVVADAIVVKGDVKYEDVVNLAEKIEHASPEALVEYSEIMGVLTPFESSYIPMGRRVNVSVAVEKSGWVFDVEASIPAPIHVKSGELAEKVKASILRILKDTIAVRLPHVKPVVDQLSESDVAGAIVSAWLDKAESEEDYYYRHHWANGVPGTPLYHAVKIVVKLRKPSGEWSDDFEFTLKGGWSKFKQAYLS